MQRHMRPTDAGAWRSLFQPAAPHRSTTSARRTPRTEPASRPAATRLLSRLARLTPLLAPLLALLGAVGDAAAGGYSCSNGATLYLEHGRERCSDGSIPVYTAQAIPVHTGQSIAPPAPGPAPSGVRGSAAATGGAAAVAESGAATTKRAVPAPAADRQTDASKARPKAAAGGIAGLYWCVAPSWSKGTIKLLPDGSYQMNGHAAGRYSAAPGHVRFEGQLKDWNGGKARIDGDMLIFDEWKNASGAIQYFAYRKGS